MQNDIRCGACCVKSESDPSIQKQTKRSTRHFALLRKSRTTAARERKINTATADGPAPTSTSAQLDQMIPLDSIPDSEAGAGIPVRPTGAPGSSPGIDVAVSLSAMALARATGSSGRTSAMLISWMNLAGLSGGVRVARAVLPWDGVARFRQEAGKAHTAIGAILAGPQNPGNIPPESETVK